MKKITISSLLIIVIASFMLIGLNFCEKQKSCEETYVGDVKIYNGRIYTITVDINLPDERDRYLEERVVLPGNSTTYANVPAGPIVIWEEDEFLEQNHWVEYLDACTLFEFEIPSSGK